MCIRDSIATQNPLESHGTYPLPESQLDRFLMRLSVGYPPRKVERELLRTRDAVDPIANVKSVLSASQVRELQTGVDEIAFADALVDYVMDIVEATRSTVRLSIGVSTRGALALQRACKAYAMIQGRDYVLPDDVQALASPVLAHRVSLGAGETVIGSTRDAASSVIEELLAGIEVPV